MRFADFCKRKKALSTIEITVVVAILLVMFVLVIDMSLYFRQPYLLQNFNDDLLVKIQLAHNCYSQDVNRPVIQSVIKKHYNKDVNVQLISGSSSSVEDGEEDGFDFPQTKGFLYDAGDFKITLACKNPQVPDSVLSIYNYKGIFLYKNKELASELSTNTTETYY